MKNNTLIFIAASALFFTTTACTKRIFNQSETFEVNGKSSLVFLDEKIDTANLKALAVATTLLSYSDTICAKLAINADDLKDIYIWVDEYCTKLSYSELKTKVDNNSSPHALRMSAVPQVSGKYPYDLIYNNNYVGKISINGELVLCTTPLFDASCNANISTERGITLDMLPTSK